MDKIHEKSKNDNSDIDRTPIDTSQHLSKNNGMSVSSRVLKIMKV